MHALFQSETQEASCDHICSCYLSYQCVLYDHVEFAAGRDQLDSFFPPTMHPQVTAEITVAAVNDNMQIDPSRDDLIRISLNPGSHAKVGLADTAQSEWAKNITVRLTNGKASFMIVGERLELVVISAEWIDGRSPLQSLTTMREVGVD